MAAPKSVIGQTVDAIREAVAPPARLLTDSERSIAAADIYEAGRLTPAYSFMLFSACGIAALGLLQSSVAVIIGAMLISPLMGPIMAMGMALARLDTRAFRSSAATLAIGAGLSVAASILIVWLSPLKDATPEILSRTRPTLLDLIVALLSGFVGAYLTVNRKGGAIAGVAIATALMPPLAVVGYGLATANWQIASGAMLLFLTNVVAILGAVYGVARRYGYRPQVREGRAWETWALLIVMTALCVPLAVSLRSIVIEARETTRVRGVVTDAFAGASPHIAELVVETERGGANEVQAVVVTRKFVPGAEARVASQLKTGAHVEIEQVVTATGVPPSAGSGGALANRVTPTSAPAGPEQKLRAMLAGVGRVESVRRDGEAVEASLVLNGSPSLVDYQAAEQAAQRFLPQTSVRLVPPLAPLPAVQFAYGSSALDADSRRTAESIGWALNRWGLTAANVEGLATPSPRGRRAADLRVAQSRGEAVASVLRERGIDVSVAASVPDAVEGDPAQYLAAQVSAAP
ncbi:hypothetical protein ASE17_06135 [Phenylobacterium sp. Root77]|uniref:TIGR00341 family protein n=1 Tax=unclassified Phenylobacterium TaxID=2640670 RepID=UPI0006FB2E9E|nr:MULTISPECIES: TIGR00341 family protein [unclassified Phenylobacterium]KQW66375.1 hypothetical protein ASC73_18490 [Phenylobacterium sp. Root1277]KQW88882.1 hypothetical protein ASC79_19395 [Phenylobacterium sp. Root1290]KRC42264.1 hypothetical protein ASE17_06135 [Phenylobacterium sp. Root77]